MVLVMMYRPNWFQTDRWQRL